MPFTVEYLEDEKLVMIKNSGELTYEDFVEQTHQALELGRTMDTRLFLTDDTSLISQAKLLEVYDFPALYERIGVPRANKLAVLLAEDSATREDVRFYETVCTNRGWNVKVFTTKEAAVEWLRG